MPDESQHEGACQCGRLRFRMTARPIFVNACHCRDCQRLTGSAFALNAMIETSRIEMLGEAWSDADRIGDRLGDRQWRCAECGVLLFAEHPAFGEAIRYVRVGTLLDGERLTPDAHFFTRSKHPWIRIPEGVPSHETVPREGLGAEIDAERKGRLDDATSTT